MKAALYARYSTDKQSESSVEDQHRACERLAAREGFAVVARYEDRAISGGTANRPGYQAMLDAARRHEFKVIVAEDGSRLWRLLAEQSPRLAELADLGIAVVTHDLDTRQETGAILGAVSGAMAEQYRREIGRRTRRGLEGLATNRKPTGSRAYGYIAARDSNSGDVEVNEIEAKTVRCIFQKYAAGQSPRQIAADLNEEGIPSPGASWRRRDSGPNAKRRGTWVASAIHGDPRRSTGILNNPRYVGRVVWGRTRWERGAADSTVRRCKLVNEPAVEYTDERLRIVSDELWQAVKSRQKRVRHASATLRNALSRSAGRNPRHLLSGLLRCESCGGNFVKVDARAYGCSSHKNGGAAACANALRISAKDAERLLLEEVEAELLSPEAIEVAVQAYRDELARRRTERRREATTVPASAQRAIAAKDAELSKLRALARSGDLPAATLQPAIDAAEGERARLLEAASDRTVRAEDSVAELLPNAAESYREAVRSLSDPHELLSPGDFAEARALIFELLGGKVPVRKRRDGRSVLALTLDPAPLLRATGSGADNVVAGAGFEPATFGL